MLFTVSNSPVLKKKVPMKVQLRKKEPTEEISSKWQSRNVESMNVTDFIFIFTKLPRQHERDILVNDS